MPTATACDAHVEQLFDRIQQLHSLLTAAGIPYRIDGGMAVLSGNMQRGAASLHGAETGGGREETRETKEHRFSK